MARIEITPRIAIDDSELRFEFVRASGPGGQNVNKVATAVQLRFDAARSPSLPDDVRERLLALAGRRATADGVIVIDARDARTQERNRAAALGRLIALIRRAARRPKRRVPTKPTAAAKRRRRREKERRAKVKRERGRVRRHEE
ncbi:MAG: aminoacyl-tRNA hydrolase [Acidobacteria bacterium]|nr:MAG: aminoacyl-tRNA hydrolase [Acidobacteriota bacterium]